MKNTNSKVAHQRCNFLKTNTSLTLVYTGNFWCNFYCDFLCRWRSLVLTSGDFSANSMRCFAAISPRFQKCPKSDAILLRQKSQMKSQQKLHQKSPEETRLYDSKCEIQQKNQQVSNDDVSRGVYSCDFVPCDWHLGVCVELTRVWTTNYSESQVDILLHRLLWVYYIRQDDNRKGLFTRAILCFAIDILEYVFNWRERRGQTTANHKRISSCVDCHEFITYTRMTIATCKVARVNGPLTVCTQEE